ncbi:zinc-binding alcohol dehydrogenase, partial [Arthrobacter sp. H5]|uniref:zinc-dependent alcohol dehydrogenase n=1 Tax=Arthrobacter sp. H5 TaxID=1267973 RepID=UPI0005600277
MPNIVQFSAPGSVELVECERQPLTTGTVRIRTWYSGISAGTELTAYRGSNPYLSKSWDVVQRIFTEGAPAHRYPVVGWGYSEVGEVVEVAEDVGQLTVGDVVYGVWGHRSEAVVAAQAVAGRQVPEGTDPLHGIFARVGAIALNAVLGANLHLGEDVAVFGQGVIGLLATRLANLSGARVIAVDGFQARRELAITMGARDAVAADAAGGAGQQIRSLTGQLGVDIAIELSGNYRALHEAVRSVGTDGRVIAAGFYQGGGEHLSLGEEFHHNRVQIIASQIGG